MNFFARCPYWRDCFNGNDVLDIRIIFEIHNLATINKNDLTPKE
jgi:hypothetical protein